MHKILQKNKNAKTEKISLKDLKEHKLFQEFEFTVDQIVEMGNENKDLEELYTE